MGIVERLFEGTLETRSASIQPATDSERGFVDSSDRSPVAGFAGAVWTLENGLPLVPSMAPGRYVGPDPARPSDPAGPRRADRWGPLVRGWQQHSGQSYGGGCRKRGDSEEPPDHALGRSRGGFGSKLHLVTDGQGVPLAVEVTAGQQHESTRFAPLLEAVRIPQPVGPPRCRPLRVAGDKGYSYPRIRAWLRQHKIEAVIPQRSDQQEMHRGRPLKFDKEAYRQRSIIERCIGWLKECRRIGTRFEKLAINFLAMVKLAIIQRYLKIAFSDRA